MAFFSYFPKIEYDVRGDGSKTVMTNLTRRTRFRDYIRLSILQMNTMVTQNFIGLFSWQIILLIIIHSGQ